MEAEVALVTAERRWEPEPELRDPPPRIIADEVRSGPWATRRRTKLKAAGLVGIACVLLGVSGLLDRLSLYVVPLGYLEWIGGATLLITALVALGKGHLRYARDGVPLRGRVVAVGDGPPTLVNGVPSEHTFLVRVEVEHPTSKLATTYDLVSEGVPWAKKQDYELALAPGDTATVLWLPPEFEKTLRLYGFLGLTAASAAVRRKAEPSSWSLFTSACLGLAIAGTILLLVSGLMFYGDATESSAPFLVALPAGVALAIPLAIWAWRKSGPDAKAWKTIPLLLLGFSFLGWLLAVGGLLTANAELDRSKPEYRPVAIVNFWQKTHTGMGIPIFRDYEIEYSLGDGAKTHRLSSTPDHIARFGDTKLGALERREGGLGWRWARQIHPAKVVGERTRVFLEDGSSIDLPK